MWEVPEDALKKLRCCLCDGYLSAPIYSWKQGMICECCFGLPSIDTKECVRQTGLEMMVPHFLYPCGNDYLGCTEQRVLKEFEKHVEFCKYNRRAFCRMTSNTSHDSTHVESPLESSACSPAWSVNSLAGFQDRRLATDSKDLKVQTNWRTKGNKTTGKLTVVNYNINIAPDKNKQICVLSNTHQSKFIHTDYVKPITLSIQGSVSLKRSPESIFCDLQIMPVDVKKQEEVASKVCISCNVGYDADMRFCNYGHSICDICKTSGCKQCAKQIQTLTTLNCRNGCAWYGSVYNYKEHERECPNVNVPCFWPGCNWNSTTHLMQQHILQKHKDHSHNGAILVSDFAVADRLWAIFAHKMLFVFKYFVYDDVIEFVVEEYSTKRHNFKYNVQVLADMNYANLKGLKTRSCSQFNNSVMDECVSVSRGAIEKINDCFKKEIKFQLCII